MESGGFLRTEHKVQDNEIAVTQARQAGEGAGRGADPSSVGRRNGLAEPSDKILGKARNQEIYLCVRWVGLLVTALRLEWQLGSETHKK